MEMTNPASSRLKEGDHSTAEASSTGELAGKEPKPGEVYDTAGTRIAGSRRSMRSQMANAIAARVRRLRLARGWSQARLAEESGLSPHAISLIERRERAARLDTLEQIAHAFGLSLPEFVDVEKPPPGFTRAGRASVVRAWS
jgi:ribosome-binding protein aMBF1 (putative translation factor)